MVKGFPFEVPQEYANLPQLKVSSFVTAPFVESGQPQLLHVACRGCLGTRQPAAAQGGLRGAAVRCWRLSQEVMKCQPVQPALSTPSTRPLHSTAGPHCS